MQSSSILSNNSNQHKILFATMGIGIMWSDADRGDEKSKHATKPDLVTDRYVPTTSLPLRKNCPVIATLLFLCLSLNISVSSGVDTISASQSLSGLSTIVSSGENFELGFFKPGNSNNYYIGIWYQLSIRTVVWVANRDRPVSDIYSAELKFVNGNLVILDESKTHIWSTNVNSTTSSSRTAVLLNDGNLVLRDVSKNSGLTIWQSFDYPTDTFLPGSKVGYNKVTGIKQVLTSWKSADDPAPGFFTNELDMNDQLLIRWNRTNTYWTSGSWNAGAFSSLPEMRLNTAYNYSYVSNKNESYFTYSLNDSSIISRMIMDVSGQVKQLIWDHNTQEWKLFWTQPSQQCDVYGACGAFGVCNQNLLPPCNCSSGFEPSSQSDWNKSDYTGGCVRKTELQCANTSRGNDKKPKFVPSSPLQWPRPSQQVPALTAGHCESMCLLNCSCSAYAFGKNATTEITDCWIWNDSIFNLKVSLQITGSERTFNIKLASPDSQTSNAKLIAGIISAIVILVVILFGSVGYVIYKRRMTKRRESAERTARLDKDSINWHKLQEDENQGIDVPFFELEVLVAATNNFANENKLGQGGFGPVYKGELPGGIEIAVKRLSSHSGQGLDEFKNEVALIAKLQHRNLVRILGYCTKGDEQILLYEYMPNKSLDTFIFDQTLCKLLDWPKRFDIIHGITRGMLYLHEDSRLRIIHRDLKTSNILLDGEMNPKISDFGLARIVGGRETEDNTKRVVGTHGYMSPEYAIDGHFSIKSDIFSFGVVVLEIISGKKITGFYLYQEALGLLGYAWNLWKEEKPLDFMDQSLVKSHNSNEVLKCIIVGLLCVQDDPGDRPTMSNVVSMLISDIGSLPNPKQPAFVAIKRLPGAHSPCIYTEAYTNEMTMSVQEGR